MEYLSRDNPNFNFHPKCARLKLKQLGFADDLLLFCREDVGSGHCLFTQFQSFTKASGLTVNQAKSSIYFGGPFENKKSFSCAMSTFDRQDVTED